MMDKKRTPSKPSCITALMILSIAIVAFLTYRDILHYFFTATDSLTLIDTSRIKSFQDLMSIFTKPMMHGTQFVDAAKYYRPIMTLSFSLDYSLWEMNPFGYHLTDLLLHISVSILIFFLVRFLSDGKQVIAWLGAVIFSTHPILVESVPAIARRQDAIAALFLLLSMLLFLKHHKVIPHRKWLLVCSLFFYSLALGSKEISVFLPFLILAYLTVFSFSDKKSHLSPKIRWNRWGKLSLPYFAVTFVFLCWRTYVLQGLGGTAYKAPPANLQEFFGITHLYYMMLLNPHGLLAAKKMGYLITTISVLVFLSFYRRVIIKILSPGARKLIKASKFLLATLLLLSSIGILAYLLTSSYTNSRIQQIYQGLFFLGICLLGVLQRKNIGRFFGSKRSGELSVFLLIWLFLPLIIYLSTGKLRLRGMYNAVIPFSAILSVMLIGSFGSAIRRIKENHSVGRFYRPALMKSLAVSVAMLIIIVGFTGSLFFYSPLVQTYEGWEASGIISSIFLNRLSQIVPKLPNDATIDIVGLPLIRSSAFGKPHAKSVTYLADYSVKSWLDINYPDNQMTVLLRRYGELEEIPPGDFSLKTWMNGNYVKVIVNRVN